MTRILTSIALALLVFSVVLCQDQARAQGPMGEWIFDTDINPDSDPLEISGGGVFPDIDTFIVLDQTDLANLQVYNIVHRSKSIRPMVMPDKQSADMR